MSILCPAKPSSAGSSVSATATITATVSPAVSPMTVTSGMPAIARPQIAITTVMPANSDGRAGRRDRVAGGILDRQAALQVARDGG